MNKGTKKASIDFGKLTEAQQNAVVKMLATNDKKIQAELERLEKVAIKQTYKGLFSIFNLIQKESTFFKSIKGKGFKAVNVLGSMDFNEFVKQTKAGGAYSFETIYNFCKAFEGSNDGDKVLIEARAETINGLIMDVKKGEISPNEAVQMYLSYVSQPFRINSKGLKVCTVSKGTAKILHAEFTEVYDALCISEFLPSVHAEILQAVEESKKETIEA